MAALCTAVLLLSVAASGADAQVQGQALHRWRLDVHAGETPTFSLLASEAPLGDVAADLAKQTKLPVTVGAALREAPITARVERRGLEAILQQMAARSRVFVDYELAGLQAPAKPVAIFFETGSGEAPALPVAQGQAEIDILSGHTEDADPASRAGGGRGQGAGSSREVEPPLVVTVENNLLTVRARRQPLIEIVYDVASKLGATVSIGAQSAAFQRMLTTPIDMRLESVDVETGVLSLSPVVVAYVRRDLTRGQTRVLRITLIERSNR